MGILHGVAKPSKINRAQTRGIRKKSRAYKLCVDSFFLPLLSSVGPIGVLEEKVDCREVCLLQRT